jgi:hypothetical protein
MRTQALGSNDWSICDSQLLDPSLTFVGNVEHTRVGFSLANTFDARVEVAKSNKHSQLLN